MWLPTLRGDAVSIHALTSTASLLSPPPEGSQVKPTPASTTVPDVLRKSVRHSLYSKHFHIL